MPLFTKCILSPIELSDGVRISVMSRHTLNDGITKHPDITALSYDAHFPVYAPSPRLLGDYYKRGLEWSLFERRYREEMRKKHDLVLELARCAVNLTITLLCIEDSPEKCHRRLLAEECKLLVPELIIVIR